MGVNEENSIGLLIFNHPITGVKVMMNGNEHDAMTVAEALAEGFCGGCHNQTSQTAFGWVIQIADQSWPMILYYRYDLLRNIFTAQPIWLVMTVENGEYSHSGYQDLEEAKKALIQKFKNQAFFIESSDNIRVARKDDSTVLAQIIRFSSAHSSTTE